MSQPDPMSRLMAYMDEHGVEATRQLFEQSADVFRQQVEEMTGTFMESIEQLAPEGFLLALAAALDKVCELPRVETEFPEDYVKISRASLILTRLIHGQLDAKFLEAVHNLEPENG